MKKLFILGASAILLGLSHTSHGQARVGLIAGPNISQHFNHFTGESVQNMLKTSWHAGGLVDICIANNFTVQPGLIYITKGGLEKRTFNEFVNGGEFERKIKEKIALHYLELPLQFTYRIPAGSNHFVIGLGGYASVLLGSHVKFEAETRQNGNFVAGQNFETERHPSIGSDENDDLKRMDYGLTGSLGWEFSNGLFIRAAMDAGLRDILHDNDFLGLNPLNVPPGITPVTPAVFNGEARAKNVSWLFSLGYWFGGK